VLAHNTRSFGHWLADPDKSGQVVHLALGANVKNKTRTAKLYLIK